jgi:hypothetical protein
MQQAAPTVGPKLVNVTNAIYEHMDLSPLMSRMMELAQTNILGAFPGANPYGFQADPDTFCLFAVPKDGVSDPTNQINSWLAKHPINNGIQNLETTLAAGLPSQLPTLPDGISSWAANKPLVPPNSDFVSYEKDGKHYACTSYEPYGATGLPFADAFAAAPSPAGGDNPSSNPLFPRSDSVLSLPQPSAVEPAPSAAPTLQSAEDFTRQYLSGAANAPADSPAAAPSLADELYAEFADGAYAAAPGPDGGPGARHGFHEESACSA